WKNTSLKTSSAASTSRNVASVARQSFASVAAKRFMPSLFVGPVGAREQVGPASCEAGPTFSIDRWGGVLVALELPAAGAEERLLRARHAVHDVEADVVAALGAQVVLLVAREIAHVAQRVAARADEAALHHARAVEQRDAE